MSLRKPRQAAARLVPLVLVLSLGLVACGGDDGGNDDGRDDSGAAAPQVVEPTPLPKGLDPDVEEAAKEAAELGMIFLTSHDEIVEKAKEAGPLNGYVSTGMAEDVAAAFTEATGIEATLEDFSGTDAYQRFLLEADADQLEDIDIQQAPPEQYSNFHALMAPYDIYGMADAGILEIPTEMIDPENRNIVAVGSQIAGFAYNPNLISLDEIPTEWEDFCDTDFLDGRPFMLDVRPSNMAPLVAEWGLDRVVDLAKCLADADPILVRGTTDALTRVTAGEVPLHIFTNYHSVVRAMEEADGNLEVGLLEPVPVRLSNALGVLKEGIAQNPYAALLLIEFMASPEGQAILDEDPLKSSIYYEGSQVLEAIGDRETSGAGFANFVRMEDWMDDIAAEFGIQ